MFRLVLIAFASLALISSAAAQPASSGKKKGKKGPHEFKPNRSGKPGLAQGVNASRITPTRTEAVLKFTVVDKDKGPIKGIVISLTDPKGKKYYTEETDAKGFTEILVPVGRKYKLVYLSLGRSKIAAQITVSDKPRQTNKYTLRYKRYDAPKTAGGIRPPQKFILKGVEFDTGKATIRKESFARLDRVVEYMTHKRSARVEISGHTDNVGQPRRNKALSQRRAQACRKYIISRGIDGSRVNAVGRGDEQPIASNDTEGGRQQNRRIEAIEL